MKKLLHLDDNYIEVEEVSYISTIGVNINHTKNPAKTFLFEVVVSGRIITFASQDENQIVSLRKELLSHFDTQTEKKL